MYQGKRIKKITHMSKRAALLVLSLVMILSVSVGGTLAYLIAQSETKTNVFQPGEVTTDTPEDFKDGQTEKKNVAVKNTGNVEVYLRAQIVINWVKDVTVDGEKKQEVLAVKPVEGTDYTLTTPVGGNWSKSGDFYYYSKPVKAGATTDYLIDSCTLRHNGPDGSHLQVTILTQAVQKEAFNGTDSPWTPVGTN